jgi:hypothetical protein
MNKFFSGLIAFASSQRLARLLLACSALLLTGNAAAADKSAAANVLRNPGFEDGSHSEDNLWDGVNDDGALAGFTMSTNVVLENGSFGTLAMPPAVGFADLNGDGKPDLITADPNGYFHFYANRGTAQAPRFTSGEIMPIFLSAVFTPHGGDWVRELDNDARCCPRFALADWRHTGLLDLMVGNYFGEVLFLPNVGTARQAVFRQPAGIKSARLATSEKAAFWGNLLSPAAVDFNHDGHLDLLVGEGTYSANSIHLLRNASTGGVPKFSDAGHTHIAYGDGREQLIPTVVDFDGDGNPDLLVADRSGEISVYLNPGKAQPPGSEFKRVSTLSFGAVSKLPGLCSVCAADFNGDGLFDLILGMPNGHIAVALNTGSKGSPQFGPIMELKGEDRFGRNINLPDGWETNAYPEQGNALGYVTVVDAKEDPASQPPEGGHCLKAGYWPLGGENYQIPPGGIPGTMKHFTVTQGSVTIKTNQTYNLSFRAKGVGMEKLHYKFLSHYRGRVDPADIERGERGGVKNHGIIDETTDIGGDFSLTSNWSTVEGTLNVQYKHNELQKNPTMTGSLELAFWATSLSSVAYFDDFQLVPK